MFRIWENFFSISYMYRFSYTSNFDKTVEKTRMTAVYNICLKIDNNTPFQSSTWRVTLFSNFSENVQDRLSEINAQVIQDRKFRYKCEEDPYDCYI